MRLPYILVTLVLAGCAPSAPPAPTVVATAPTPNPAFRQLRHPMDPDAGPSADQLNPVAFDYIHLCGPTWRDEGRSTLTVTDDDRNWYWQRAPADTKGGTICVTISKSTGRATGGSRNLPDGTNQPLLPPVQPHRGGLYSE